MLLKVHTPLVAGALADLGVGDRSPSLTYCSMFAGFHRGGDPVAFDRCLLRTLHTFPRSTFASGFFTVGGGTAVLVVPLLYQGSDLSFGSRQMFPQRRLDDRSVLDCS